MTSSASCAADWSASQSRSFLQRFNQKNVGDVERAASVGIGAGLIVAGAKCRGITGLLMAGVGAALAYRGYSGKCPAYSAMGLDTAHIGKPAQPEDFFER